MNLKAVAATLIGLAMGVNAMACDTQVSVCGRDPGQAFGLIRARQPVSVLIDPGFSTWARAKFGGINSKTYSAVFELMLRLKSNYLWPAMWAPKAFNADDPQSMVLADQMGITMGTSHHEPMVLAHDEWARSKGGKWDYDRSAPKLREFWRSSFSCMMSKGNGAPYESLVTIGMRGDGDEPKGEGTAIGLLEGIVADQRQIIADVTGKPADQTPQMWALYKEVQDYYDKGMKVPDDVLLLFSDDNWGHVRRLPRLARDRKGGCGIYYHFDDVGGARNYKWLNAIQIEKTWQQMNLAYERGGDDLWVVNVGDIKPLEFPISFFLDMAWNPAAMGVDAMSAYPARWAAATFGPSQARDIAAIVTRYSQYAARRKPELVDAQSFALGEATAEALDGGEFGALVAQWAELEQQVAVVRKGLQAEQLDAFFQVVEHPVLALGNLYKLYYYVAWNRKLAAAGDARANAFADLAEAAHRRDQEITDRYHAIHGGKWAGMMQQTHMGYTSWRALAQQIMPTVKRVAGANTALTGAVLQLLAVERAAAVAKPHALVIEAPNFSRAFSAKGLRWTAIPHLGHSQGAVTALPQGREPTTAADQVRLEYEVQTTEGADATLQLIMVPTLDTLHAGGARLAVAIDDRPAQVLKLDLVPTGGTEITPQEQAWARAMRDSAAVINASFKALPAGQHVIRIWRLDDNAVLQRLVLGLHDNKRGAAAPAPQGAAVTGVYRNLLREWRPEISEAVIDRKLSHYWQSLFEGGADRRVYYPSAPTPDGPAAYILDVGNRDVRSEGMSYGMMIAVQMNRKAAFDALWNWAATHMRYREGPRAGYFRWQCRPSGCDQDAVPASDGEEYFATALLMAASRWGNGTGIYDYAAQANALLDAMLHKEAMNGGVVEGARSIFSAQYGQVVFVPVGDAATFSDPSYHLPAFYELWSQRAKGWQGRQEQDRKRWSEIAQISRAYFDKSAHPRTALTPDYAEFDGRPRHFEGHGDFRFDAFRTAVNWTVDQLWWGKNPRAADLSSKLLTFFDSQGKGSYPALYHLDGKALNDEPAHGLIACNAVAAMLVDGPLAQRFVRDLWELDPPTGEWRYYNGLLQFMAVLHVSGRFRAW